MEIENFKFKDFIEQPEDIISEYSLILSNLKPIDTPKEIFYLSLEDVEFIKDNFGNDSFEDLINIFKKVGIEDPLNCRIITLYPMINSINSQRLKILKSEQALIPTSTDIKAKAVNYSENVAKFGIYNTLDRLAGGDILKYDLIRKLPYSEVFTKLLMDVTKDNLKAEMDQIKSLTE